MDVTSTIHQPQTRQIHIRRGRLSCVGGPDQGQTWTFDGDVCHIGSLPGNDVIVHDTTVSRRHAEIVRGRDGVLLRDLGSTNGTFIGQVRVREVYLTPETRFRLGKTELLFSPEDEIVDIKPSDKSQLDQLVGRSLAMREVFSIIERVAHTDLTVLITGETGTGKELASRAVHNLSLRRGGPFCVFDCGAAPETLIESELFGHEKGSFTGAHQSREGVFEAANGGTIFLDEIGELPLELQPKLLRVLEQREVRRVGSGRTKEVDVRVVAATNRDLLQEVREGRFREDLYYRLAVVEILLPPLRERGEDLPLIAQHLLLKAQRGAPRVHHVSPEVMEILGAWRFPGNVRELANLIERALPFTDGDTITLQALPEALRDRSREPLLDELEEAGPRADLPFKDAKERMIEGFEKRYLIDLIERHGGNVSKADRAADMDRKSIARLLKKYRIPAKG